MTDYHKGFLSPDDFIRLWWRTPLSGNKISAIVC